MNSATDQDAIFDDPGQGIRVPLRCDGPPAASCPAATTSVLHLINGQHYAGAERVQDLLAAGLPEFGFAVAFACLKPDHFPKMRRTQEAPLYRVPMRTRLDLMTARKVARLIRRNGCRLVHAHTPRTGLIGRLAARLAGVPLVYHVHSPAARDTTQRFRNRINALIERWCLDGAGRVIAVSESLGQQTRRLRSVRCRLRVVPNGVPKPGRLRSAAPPTAGWTVGTVALFRPRKGIEVLVDALAILRRQGVRLQLRAVGPFETPEYETAIKSQVERLGLADLVEWTGFQSDVNTQLSQMDAFVLPSLFGEGLPMVVLEAMAAGVPVVATRVEGVPEAIRDGQDGLLAEPGDAESLAACMKRIAGGQIDWALLRRNALSRHAQGFSDRSMASGVAAVYRELLGDPAAR